MDQDFARGQVPGHYELCVCEAEAVPMSLICQGWHHLGHLEVFGPLQLKHALHGSVGEAMHIDLDGLGFSSGDSLVSVPLDSELMRPETACIGDLLLNILCMFIFFTILDLAEVWPLLYVDMVDGKNPAPLCVVPLSLALRTSQKLNVQRPGPSTANIARRARKLVRYPWHCEVENDFVHQIYM